MSQMGTWDHGFGPNSGRSLGEPDCEAVVENSSIYAPKRTISFPGALLDTTVLYVSRSFKALYKLGR